MDVSGIKNAILNGSSLISETVSYIFGGWSNDLETLIIFMIIDYITGIICAGILKNSQKTEKGALESKVGWKGLIKKCYTLLFVLIAHRLDLAIEVNYIKTTVIIGFIINEGLSIIENAGLIGIPLPNSIKNSIEILRNKIKKNDTLKTISTSNKNETEEVKKDEEQEKILNEKE